MPHKQTWLGPTQRAILSYLHEVGSATNRDIAPHIFDTDKPAAYQAAKTRRAIYGLEQKGLIQCCLRDCQVRKWHVLVLVAWVDGHGPDENAWFGPADTFAQKPTASP